MTVFKTFWKIVSKNKLTIAIYVLIAVVFSAFGAQTNTVGSYVAAKPKIVINNQDDGVLAQGLTRYLSDNADVVQIASDKIGDALFYRELDYIIDIPNGYSEAVWSGRESHLNVQKTDGYGSELAERMIERYGNMIAAYRGLAQNQTDLVAMVRKALGQHVDVKIVADRDVGAVGRVNYYFNYMAYTILGGLVFILSAVLASFYRPVISKRIAASGLSSGKYNWQLLLACAITAVLMWLLLIAIGAMIAGQTIWSVTGLLMIVNSFVFTVCCLALAYLIANITTNREVISGVVNVVALTQAFLCGVFIPLRYMPGGVASLAHALPAYWYVEANNLAASQTSLDWLGIWPIVLCWLIMIVFAVAFTVVAILIARRNQQLEL